MDSYISFVTANPLLSAAIQFGLLGTLGEFISHLIRAKSASGFGKPWQVPARMLAWALLGIIIKYGFVGMRGFVDNLLSHALLPGIFSAGVGYAFAISGFTNLLFGPQMMAIHRVEDNLIFGTKGFAGIATAWRTLIWFWIPAHTITFSLPPHFQIGLAAAWSVALGIILGLAKARAAKEGGQS